MFGVLAWTDDILTTKIGISLKKRSHPSSPINLSFPLPLVGGLEGRPKHLRTLIKQVLKNLSLQPSPRVLWVEGTWLTGHRLG